MKKDYRVHGNAYKVADRHKNIEDEDWYEYRVTLWEMTEDGEQPVDSWDSFMETYNGMEGQRLTEEQAEDAVQEIKSDVKGGNADDWFDL